MIKHQGLMAFVMIVMGFVLLSFPMMIDPIATVFSVLSFFSAFFLAMPLIIYFYSKIDDEVNQNGKT